uniref:Calmodulin (Trinotate prediction) n=1 Tax=Henneguya salminicola TaxID=69463 RepID=A0A6G3MLL3_HENSL
MTMHESITQDQERQYKEAFNVFDKDGDGSISSKKLGTVMRSIGVNPTEVELQDMINAADSSGSGLINFEQFKSMVGKKILSSNVEEEVREAFKVFDKNGTGFINSGEFCHFLTSLGDKLADDEADALIRCLDPRNSGEVDFFSYSRSISMTQCAHFLKISSICLTQIVLY